MSTQRSSHSQWTLVLRLFAVLALMLAAVAPMQAFAQEEVRASGVVKSPNGVYIVQMADPTVISARNAKPDLDVQAYVAQLDGNHATALAAVGGGEKLYDFRYTFNGFAAKLTQNQAAALTKVSGVVSVVPDELRKLDTVSTPTFLGLDKKGGLWEQVGGPSQAGEGVVVGIVDSGIWPESLSFADDGSYRPLLTWMGECVTGEEWDASNCSGKVVGARYFYSGWGDVKALFPWEYLSARDADGHGSHTASTAAGNYGVPASALGADLGKISGMAPRARIAIYKVCWGGSEGGCFSSDSMAAIEAATMDNVDVINYSISGSRTSVTDPVETAFLEATAAGVFVAASAGNSGPTASTVAHNSPWITTVAAGTHDRGYAATVTLGDGSVYVGVSLGNGTDVAPLIKSTSAGLPGANPTQVQLCYPGTLDPAVVTGKIVQCDRGVIARVDKSLAVQMAGGAGMILTNVSPSSLNADLHYVPTVHTDEVVGAAIKAYIDAVGAAATAQLSAGQIYVQEAPSIASFSSRGPARALNGNLLKPDIMAPGVDVLAAVSPAAGGLDFNFYSGTSMSSPHIAGLAALMKDRQPAWTPDMIKSAFMTTAKQTTNFGNPIPGNPFGYGAGQVDPTAAADPGLVYKLPRFTDYYKFLQGMITPSNLNLPSIAVGALAGTQTVQRTVTNVTNKAATYTASIEGLDGFNVTVTPSTIVVPRGGSVSFTVKFDRTTAPLNVYTFGALKWTDGKHVVRSPIAIRPVALAAPAEIAGAGVSGSSEYSVVFGYDGDFAALPHGLVPATMTAGTVEDDPTNSFVPGGPGTVAISVDIPAGTEYARFQLFDEYTDGQDDIDLYVYRGGTLVGSSGSGTSAEQVNLVKPVAATYTVYVHGWQTDGPDANFTLFHWLISAADAGNMTVTAPATAVLGTPAMITVDWTGLDAGTKYLGTVTYHNVAAPATYDDGRIGATIVGVSTD